MKILLTSFLLLTSIKAFSFVPGLLETGREMVSLIEDARICSLNHDPKKNELVFCTGLTLKENDLNFLKNLSFKGCKEFLKTMKFDVYVLRPSDKVKGIDQKEINYFFDSTKLALILHKEKVILFKEKAKRGDCLHEVLHFYQRHRETSSKLSPLNRKDYERRLQDLLEKAVVEVEKVEKSGNKEKAKRMAAQLGPFITLQKEWKNMINWLDEKEIYQAFFDYAGLFKVSKPDIDVSLANLVRLKDSLPWRLRERVLFRANVALTEKYQSVKTPVVWKGSLDEKTYEKDFNLGKISRDKFEEKVIALRKFKLKKELDKKRRERDVMGELKILGKVRDFKKEVMYSNKESIIELTKVRGLPGVKVFGESFALDTGAEYSTLHPKFLSKLKRNAISLIGSRTIQTLYGKAEVSPVIQITKSLNVSNVSLKGLTFTVVDLKIPGIAGVLGMDFFKRINGGKWTFDLKAGILSPLKKTVGVTESFKLERNGLDDFNTLTFSCEKRGESIRLRLDSGSQILADILKGSSLMAFERCFGKGLRSKVNIMDKTSLLFDKGVEGNLGNPFIDSFSYLSFDLQEGEIYFTKGKK